MGYGEEDFSEDYQEAFKQLAQTENADAIRSALEQKDWRKVLRLIDRFDDDALEPAISYLQTLDDQTPEAFAQCLQWLATENSRAICSN